MNVFFLKIAVLLAATIVAAALWLGLMLMLRYSGSNDLIVVGFYLSHLSAFGWILFLVLIVVIYKLVMRRIIPLSAS